MLSAIQNGFGQVTWQENYAYAEGWDEDRKRDLNLKACQTGSVVLDNRAVIVKPAARWPRSARTRGLPLVPGDRGPARSDAGRHSHPR